MFGLREDSWILTRASTFNWLQQVALVEAYEENLASRRYLVVKVRCIFIAFPGHGRYSLMLHQNSTSSNFLMIHCHVESSLYCIKNTTLNITTNLIRKVWVRGSCQLTVADTNLPRFSFLSASSTPLQATNTANRFPRGERLTRFISEKVSANT